MPAINFSTNGYTPKKNEGFDDVPPGDYKVALVKSEVRDNRRSEGSHLSLQFAILEGPNKNRRIFETLNLWHSNPTAVQLANDKLYRLCIACGIPEIQRTEQLHNIPLMLRYGEGKDGRPQVKSYFARETNGFDTFEHAASFTPPPSGADMPLLSDDDIPF